MHILTKVFVLIASILSVAMAALSVSFAANAGQIREDYSNAVAAKEAAVGALAAGSDAATRIQTDLQGDIDRLQQEKAGLEANIRENEATISDLTIRVRKAEAAKDSIESKIAQLGVTTQTQAELIAEYKREVERLRDGELDWRDVKLDLEAALSDAQSQLLVFDQANRALHEQLTDAQREIAEIRGGGVRIAGGEDALPQEIAGPRVTGTVQEVRVEPATGETIVRVSIGENDRVRNNSKLYLQRNGRTYLADLVIFETDLNYAVGRVRNLQPGLDVRVGDRAQSRLDG